MEEEVAVVDARLKETPYQWRGRPCCLRRLGGEGHGEAETGDRARVGRL